MSYRLNRREMLRSTALAGAALWLPGRYAKAVERVTMQGAMLMSKRTLYVPQGRSAPLAFSRADGQPLGALGRGNGGTYAILTPQSQLIFGPGNKAGALAGHDDADRQHVLSFPDARRMVVVGEKAYVQRKTGVEAFRYAEFHKLNVQIRGLSRRRSDLDKQRKKVDPKKDPAKAKLLADQVKSLADEIANLREAAAKCSSAWPAPCPPADDLIAAGAALIAGGDGWVRAFDTKSGKQTWSAQVDGKAAGLAVADGRLYVSTDLGLIYCFAKAAPTSSK